MGKLDRRQKTYFEDPKRFADLWNGIQFHGEQVISGEELQEINAIQTYVSEGEDEERTADMIMKRKKNGEELGILILENQKMQDYSMPARILFEEGLAYQKQVREIRTRNKELHQKLSEKGVVGEYLYYFMKEDRLRPVTTLVLYWGEEEWDGARSLHELIDFRGAEEMRSMVPEFPIHLVDMSKVEGEECFQTDLRTLIALYKRRNDKTEFMDYIDHCGEEIELGESGMLVLGELTGSKELIDYARQTKWKKKTKKNKTEPEGRKEQTMCRAITELIEDGRKEGLEAGRKEGLEVGRKEGLAILVKGIENAMKNFHVSLQEACEGLGSSVEEYEKAKQIIS